MKDLIATSTFVDRMVGMIPKLSVINGVLSFSHNITIDGWAA
jgi:hypothetical protein